MIVGHRYFHRRTVHSLIGYAGNGRRCGVQNNFLPIVPQLRVWICTGRVDDPDILEVKANVCGLLLHLGQGEFFRGIRTDIGSGSRGGAIRIVSIGYPRSVISGDSADHRLIGSGLPGSYISYIINFTDSRSVVSDNASTAKPCNAPRVITVFNRSQASSGNAPCIIKIG